ncbi:MAG: methyltransferase domain-containing protein [Bacteroidota bacterium]
MNGILLESRAGLFREKLDTIKREIDPNFPWYPYRSMDNFSQLKYIFNKFPLETLVGQELKTLDFGSADGDLSFFLESLGYNVDIFDFPPTNFNGLRGARLLKQRLNSAVNIYECDLDSQFPPLTEKYGVIFLLGILYHLKNPYYILENLNKNTDYLIVSTRIARYTPDGTKIERNPVAYLLGPTESNNDATNYWIFSSKGLERIFERTGWEIKDMFTIGDTRKSNPSDNKHDERAFALLKSKHFSH